MNVSMIRSYPSNSPQALARVVAAILVADGRLDDAELAQLEDSSHIRSIGLDALASREIIHNHLVDLALASPDPEHARLNDPRILDRVFADLSDPEMRLKACGLALAAIGADDEVADSEQAVFGYMLQHWQLDLATVHDWLLRQTR